MVVHRATRPEQRIGYLLVNPGGPGESGIQFALSAPFGQFSDEVTQRFDIVGFDPRGVGFSEPAFACGAPGEQLALLNSIEGYLIDTPEEIALGEAAANWCIESMGPVGGLLHSEYVARDMDEIRQALGVDQISYLGYSYGSVLGVWYATLFPDAVRAMVVDGADNPVDEAFSQEERLAQNIQQIEPVEAQLNRALMACDTPQCPIYNDGDPIGYYMQAAAKLPLANQAAGNNPTIGYWGVISRAVQRTGLAQTVAGIVRASGKRRPGDYLGSGAVQVSVQLGGDPTVASFTEHVNCLDELVLNPEYDRATQLEDEALLNAAFTAERFPLLKAAVTPAHSACIFYDQFAPDPYTKPLNGGGAAILVIGNREDPATPFTESEELVIETLNNGYLLETAHFQAHRLSRKTIASTNMCTGR